MKQDGTYRGGRLIREKVGEKAGHDSGGKVTGRVLKASDRWFDDFLFSCTEGHSVGSARWYLFLLQLATTISGISTKARREV